MTGTQMQPNSSYNKLCEDDILSLQLLAGIVQLVMANPQWDTSNRRWGFI